MTWFEETLYSGAVSLGYAQKFEVSRVIHRETTGHQDLIIFDTPSFGRVLALDGIIQTTEKDEFTYHEMLAHVPLLAHGRARRVLVIGGGDGGVLREVLQHPIDSATLVEIDRHVIDLCLAHLPSLSNGAFDDPRTRLVIGDGLRFVQDINETFDVIIVDSTDPVGPGEILFSEAFYGACKNRLSAGGILVSQNGVPQFQASELTDSHRRLRHHFDDAVCYLTVVPTYVGGFMALGWATDDLSVRQQSLEVLASRYEALGLVTRYYTPAVHVAAFALPPFISRLLS